MSYNGSGTFVVNSSGQPVVTGTVISSTAFNALTADLATGLSTAITKDGQTTTTARIVFAQGVSSTLVTDATSATTGSIITAGGISTQKALWVGTTSRLVGNVQADGLLGIGMTPSNVLDITQNQNNFSIAGLLNNSAGGGAGADFRLANASHQFNMLLTGTGYSGTGSLTSDQAILYTTAGNGLYLNANGQPIIFGNSFWTESARFGSDGSFLVGTTTNGGWATNYKSEIKASSNGLSLYSTVAGTCLSVRVDSLYVGVGYFANFFFGSSSVGTITTNNTTTAYNTSSDYRLKENVKPMTGGIATVAALKPVTYDWISNGSAGEGFIAHELQAVIPAAVTGEKDAVDDKGEIKPQGVDFGKIVPHLVAAIQELTTRLAALESK